MHRAIETRYSNRRFRSRLEARYAVFFDALGISWDYESEGFELGDGLRYLPDFFLTRKPGARDGYWIEIKPVDPDEREIEKMLRLVRQTGHVGYFFIGPPDRERVFATNRLGTNCSLSGLGIAWSAPLVNCGAPGTPARFREAARRAVSARFEFGEQGDRS